MIKLTFGRSSLKVHLPMRALSVLLLPTLLEELFRM
jgi:hypothetical protein